MTKTDYAAMTDDIDQIKREFETAIAMAVEVASAAFEQLRAAAGAAHGASNDAIPGRMKLIPIHAAARYAGISPQRMRALCRDHVYSADDGFGLKRGSRWIVVEERFVAWLAAKPRVIGV